jgi:excisionase family DNA binding protein
MTRRTPTGPQATSAPTEDDRRLAGEASRRLAAFPATATRLEIHAVSQSDEVVEIPAAVLPLLRQVLDQFADGTPVAVLADDAELSTQQAADYLGVSRPFFIGLLDRGVMPFRKVGAHRRIRARDVIDHKRRDQADRLKALEELAAQAQELGLGY